MSSQPHCSVIYHQYNGADLESQGHKTSAGVFGNNPPFTSPPMTKIVFDGLVEAVHNTYEAYTDGGLGQKGAYLIARVNLITALDTTAKYVDELPGVTEAIIILAGFKATKTGDSTAVIPATPELDKVERGVTGVLMPECKTVHGADFYGCLVAAGEPLAGIGMNSSGQIVAMQDSGPAPVPGPPAIALVIDVNKSRKKKITGLVKGVDYYIYFYAGNSAGVSDLSEPVVIMCG